MPQAAMVGAMAAPAIISAFKGQSNEEKNLMKANTGLAVEQTALGRLLRGQGERLFGMSAPAYNQGLGFYKNLIAGGPALTQQMGVENSLTQQAFDSAKRGLEQAGIRGGVGEQAKADLLRQKAATTAGMVPFMRSGAAERLMSGGLGGLGTSAGFGGAAVSGLGNAGMTYASLMNNMQTDRARSDRMWSELGGSLGQILLPYLLNYKGASKASPLQGRPLPTSFMSLPTAPAGNYPG
jgi:hypothetical protein